MEKYFHSLTDPDITMMSSSIASFEILARNTHKGTAVLKLAELLGIDKSHTGAIGIISTITICSKALECPPAAVRLRKR